MAKKAKQVSDKKRAFDVTKVLSDIAEQNMRFAVAVGTSASMSVEQLCQELSIPCHGQAQLRQYLNDGVDQLFPSN